MKNLWSETEAQALDELDKLVYMSRLIGADPVPGGLGRRQHLHQDY